MTPSPWLPLLVVPAVLVVVACHCQDRAAPAADRMTAKYEDCGFDTTTDGEDGEDAKCAAELATQSSCLADCIEAADCDALTSTDPAVAQDYWDCLAECVGGAS